ncbi:hypothetical protein [Haliea sp.]|jgi:hypothetical protein|uniref:hypothetical protein n=1 Tax=Haliea sp. TaxID=1932666 RepID=UPI000C4ECA4E|nr:hypothetical protein [Haliea sp.]MAD65023.1 hypothetical protein [Haliea sp.]MAY94525.1 hypothetical protein [Haliea sp.]MBP71530.1 hypothetical protein [Haliea sp.]|tara:strand:- start:4674 stop:5171 length:498 start_codon:yes stop_codon:yes gene_type:complete
MTGIPISDTADGIWDDGEWISWQWINGNLHEQDIKAEFPHAPLEIIEVFQDLVQCAAEYHELTGRYLQIWGELGELYAEIKYGIERHRPGMAGSDGRMGNDWVEIKTISPEKGKGKVLVKRAGNFNKLLVVRITEHFQFESRLIDRKQLGKGRGKNARYTWNSES